MSDENTNEDQKADSVEEEVAELTEEEKRAMYTDDDLMYFTRGMLKQIVLFGEKVAELEQRVIILEQKNE